MSLENAKGFVKKIGEDKEFEKKISDAPDKETRLKLAKEAGFDFTPEELTASLKEERELSDEDLENVAGGKTGIAPGLALGNVISSGVLGNPLATPIGNK